MNLQEIQDYFSGAAVGATIANLLIALLILLIGYILARVIASVVRRLLQRIDLDNRIAAALSEPGEEARYPIEEVVGKVTFWVIMLFVIVAFLDRLNLSGISAPLSAFLDQLTTVYLPRLGAAAVLLLIAWLVASALRILVRKGAKLLRFDERLSQYGALEEGERVNVAESLAAAVFWFTLLLFLPAILNALGIASIAAPVQSIFDDVFAYVPNILAAVLIALIGWIVARIVRQIVTGLLKAIGTDRLGLRAGLAAERSLSDLIGTIIYILLLLVVIIAALGQLNIPAISQPLTMMLTSIVNFIPDLVGALLVLFLAYFVGRIIAGLVRDLLANTGFDALPRALGLNWSASRAPSSWAGSLVLIVIMIFAATAAVEILGSQFLVDALDLFVSFLWSVFLAAIVFAVGLYFARLAYRVVLSTGTDNALLLARLARIAIIVFAAAVALRELGIADDIINLAFGITLGALGVAAALAFGLGSREIAGREVERFVAAMREPQEPVDDLPDVGSSVD